MTCTAQYTTTAADVTAGHITNIATATGEPVAGSLTPAQDTVTITANAAPEPGLTLDKTADTATYVANQTINYSYLLTNSGTATLYAPYTVTDDMVTVTCPSAPATLAPAESVTCTSSYTASQAQFDGGTVITNHATAHAYWDDGTAGSGHAQPAAMQPVNSNEDSVSVPPAAAPAPALTLDKTADTATYDAAQVITYSYLVTNTGSVAINNIALNDDRLGAITCPNTTLAAGASMTCTAQYTTVAADMTAGHITNTATVTGDPAGGGDPVSAQDSVTITANGEPTTPEITLRKTANVEGWSNVGDVIQYSYEIRNTGPTTVDGPFSVDDDKVTVTCPSTPASLAPDETIVCTATYTTTDSDVNHTITNHAIAHAGEGEGRLDSNDVTLDVPFEGVGAETATPTARHTPPATNTPNGRQPGDGMPLLLIVLSLALAGFALVGFEVQRKFVRR